MRNKKIFKFLSIFILLFSFINISNAIDLPTAYNSAASDIASPEKVRKAIDIRYPELKDRYCKDYRASTQTNIKLVVRC
jgi:biopolymer transport protein ExbD